MVDYLHKYNLYDLVTADDLHWLCWRLL